LRFGAGCIEDIENGLAKLSATYSFSFFIALISNSTIIERSVLTAMKRVDSFGESGRVADESSCCNWSWVYFSSFSASSDKTLHLPLKCKNLYKVKCWRNSTQLGDRLP